MKWPFKTVLLVMVFFTTLQTSFAQTAKDIFDESKPITYLGIDFSDVRLVGVPDYDIEEVIQKHFRAINGVIVTEAKKYDFKAIFHRADVTTDISDAEAKNKAIDPEKIKSTNEDETSHFTAASLDKMVKGYNFGSKKGIGAIVFMETMNKGNKDLKKKSRGSLYVVFLDMGSKKVLLSERFEYEPGMSIGFRNNWLSVIKKAFDEIENSKYKSWKKANS